MITIKPDNQIDRDGEIIGQIVGEIAWMKAKQAPRIIGQIRQVAGIDGLKFEIADTPEEQVNLPPPISSADGVDNGSVMEPATVSDDAVAGIPFQGFKITETNNDPEMNQKLKQAKALLEFDIPADFGAPGTEYFRRCFVNHYGPESYNQYAKQAGI